MTVKVGDTIPSGNLGFMGEKGPEGISTDDLFNGKKVVVFGVPGAFTPTCSESHLPSFIANCDKIEAKGVDRVVCVSVNDPFVMGAWSKTQNAEHLLMAADGSGTWIKALGLELDLIERGLGVRSQRFSMIVDNGKITHLNVEDGPAYDVSSAEKILEQLG
ncbi:peroxiredoxin [Chromatiales bacterium (ex Bugula neritina AB1)]|nr:peroxiredoxin [Chromatiales bacterium (ex Bugula neritina AB1)]